MNKVSSLSVAQVTDIHLFADKSQELLGIPTLRSFQAVIERLQKLQPQPDLLLLTGDLSQDGSPQSYQYIQKLLSPLDTPTFWLPGNHDCLSTMQQVLHIAPLSSRKAFAWGSWNFILINSGVPGCAHGHVSLETQNWLDSRLKLVGNQPTLVALHHPPFSLSSHWLDTSSLQNPQELFAVLDRHPQVRLVLFGHIHQEYYHQRNGVHYLGSPATSVQFEPESSSFSLAHEQPGFRLLTLNNDGSWETRIERVSFAYQLDVAATGY